MTDPQKTVRLTESPDSVPLLPEPGGRIVRVPRDALGVQGRAGARTIREGAPSGFKRRVARPTWTEASFSSWGSPRRRRRR